MKGFCNVIGYRYRLHHGNCFKKRVWKQRKHFFSTRILDRWDGLDDKAVLVSGASVLGVILVLVDYYIWHAFSNYKRISNLIFFISTQ